MHPDLQFTAAEFARVLNEQRSFRNFWQAFQAKLQELVSLTMTFVQANKLDQVLETKLQDDGSVVISLGDQSICIYADNRIGVYTYLLLSPLERMICRDVPLHSGTFRLTGTHLYDHKVQLEGTFKQNEFKHKDGFRPDERWSIEEQLAQFFIFKLINPEKDDQRFIIRTS